MRPYYTLIRRENGTWSPEFGDYDRTVVEFELQDHRDHGVKLKDLKIIKTSVRHEEVLTAIAVLNTK